MKQLDCLRFSTRMPVVVLAATLLLAMSARGDWLWNSTTKTLADGNWVLKATLANGTELSITGVDSVVSPTTLDLRAPVKDAAETAFQIVSVNGFEGRAGLTHVTLPDTLRTIGKAAFRNCTGLQSVYPMFPSSLVAFGGRAFANCTSLQGAVVFPANTIAIDASWDGSANGFFNGSKIASVDMSAATFTTITDNSFANCSNLEWAKLPNGLTGIGATAFWKCTSLTNITPFLPSTVTTIGAAAFYYSDKLAGDLVIANTAPVTLTRHGNNGYGLFEGTAIRSATLTAPSTTLSGGMFRNCKSLEWAVLPDALESSTYGGDFSGCTSLTNVTPFLPSGMKVIGNGMFDGCTSLATPLVLEGNNAIAFNNTSHPGSYVFRNTKVPTVAITAPVTQIGGPSYGSTFATMKSLHTITFPETLTYLGANVLNGDTALTNVYFTGDCPATIASSVFTGITDYQTRVFVPRFNHTWEAFAATNAAIAALDEATTAQYRAKYPTGSPPLGVWTLSSKHVWYSDKPYDGPNAFYVRGMPNNIGEVSPAYGMTTNAVGSSVACTAPETAIYNGIYYICEGSVLETETAERVWGNAVTNSGLSRIVEQVGDETRRLTWLWKMNAFRIETSTYGGGSGTVDLDPASMIGDNNYAAGIEVTLTAEPAPGHRFVRWVGDVPEDAATLATVTLVVDSAKTCRPVFSSGWTYDAGTITDGNWVLAVTVSAATNLSITAVNSVGSPEVLDLQEPVSDAGAAVYHIASLTGFANQTQLTHVYLPDSLNKIGMAAFRGCSSLVFVSPLLPAGLTTMGGKAFAGCTSLRGDVVFPPNDIAVETGWETGVASGFFNGAQITSVDMSAATLTTITENSFNTCSKLAWAKLPNGLTTIESTAFWQCTALTNVTPFLPSTVNVIGAAAFYYSSKLEGDLVIANTAPVTLSRHGNNGFGLFEGTAIRSATLTAPSTTLCGGMFRNCKRLEWVVLPDALESSAWGSDFSGCTSLTNVTPFLPSGMKVVGSYMFDGCTNLCTPLVMEGPHAITFDNTSYPGSYVFRNTKVPTVAITAPVTQIGGPSNGSTFAAMKSLHTITFPETLAFLGANVLNGDTALTNVYFTGDCPTNLSNSAFSALKDYQTRILVPRSNATWENFRAERVDPMDESLRTRYREAYPDGKLPIGVYAATATSRLWYMLWTPPNAVLNRTLLLVR